MNDFFSALEAEFGTGLQTGSPSGDNVVHHRVNYYPYTIAAAYNSDNSSSRDQPPLTSDTQGVGSSQGQGSTSSNWEFVNPGLSNNSSSLERLERQLHLARLERHLQVARGIQGLNFDAGLTNPSFLHTEGDYGVPMKPEEGYLSSLPPYEPPPNYEDALTLGTKTEATIPSTLSVANLSYEFDNQHSSLCSGTGDITTDQSNPNIEGTHLAIEAASSSLNPSNLSTEVATSNPNMEALALPSIGPFLTMNTASADDGNAIQALADLDTGQAEDCSQHS